MKYLSELPAHDPKKYRMNYTGRLETAPPELWIDEHGYVDIGQILQKKILKYEREIVNLETPGWIEKQRLAFDDAYQKPKHVYISSQLEKIEKEKADWEREDHRDNATKAAESLGDKKAHDVFFRYERWWRHLDNVKSAKELAESLTDLPHALIDEIEERYGVELIVARAASMYTGKSSVVVDNSKLHEELNDYAAKVMELEAENKKLLEKIEYQNEIIEANKEWASDARDENEELEAENKNLEKQNIILTNKKAGLQKDFDRMNKQRIELKKRLGGDGSDRGPGPHPTGEERWRTEDEFYSEIFYRFARMPGDMVDKVLNRIVKKYSKQGEKIMLKPIPAHDPEVYDMDKHRLYRTYGNTFPLKWFIKPDGTLDPHRAETIRKELFAENRKKAISAIEIQKQTITDLEFNSAPSDMIQREKDNLEKMKAQVESNDKETASFDKQMEDQAVIRALYVAEKLEDHSAIAVLEAEKGKKNATFSSDLVWAVQKRYGFFMKYVSSNREWKAPANHFEQLEKKVEALEEVVDMQEKIEKLEAENKLYQEKVSMLVDQKTKMKEDIADLKKQRGSSPSSPTIVVLQKRIDELTEENKHLKEDLAELSQNLEKALAAKKPSSVTVAHEKGKSLLDAVKGAVEDSKTCTDEDMKIYPESKEEATTHKFTYKYSYISGQHGKDLIHLYIGINSTKTGQSDLKKLAEDSQGMPREVVAFFEFGGGKTWLDGETMQPVAFRRAHQFDGRGNTARIVFEIPHKFRTVEKLWLNIHLQEMLEKYNPRKAQSPEVAKWCPPLRIPLYMNQVGTDWLLHEKISMFKDLGGFVPPEKTDDPLKPLLDEVWSKARLMEAKNAIVWKKWQAIWDLLSGNYAEITPAEIKEWHDEAKLKDWKPALETLPKVIAFLENKE